MPSGRPAEEETKTSEEPEGGLNQGNHVFQTEQG